MNSDLNSLRLHAISHSLFEPTTLKTAVKRSAFIQADPIRSPARAQDLILRHRVNGYCAGDLERRYPSLDLEEDVLYAYGFLPGTISRLLHPRPAIKLSKMERRVLDTVTSLGAAHPKDLASQLGRKRVVNAWGGHSAETTRALERLHYRGYLRVVRRENGIRIYGSSRMPTDPMPPEERLRALIKVIVNVLGPVSERTVFSSLMSFRRSNPKLENARATVASMIRTGELSAQTVDGITYILASSKSISEEAPRKVRFLAPFDPLVWDRQRFEHFWGWKYRFEAYTPPAKRIRGYYALPLLWMSRMVGWANVNTSDGHMKTEVGFVEGRPREKDFNSELGDEIGRMESFLNRRNEIEQY